MAAVAAGFLYSFINVILVLKPFLFSAGNYDKLARYQPAVKEVSILSIPQITSEQQIKEVAKLLEKKSPDIFAAVNVTVLPQLEDLLKQKFTEVIAVNTQAANVNPNENVVAATNLKIDSFHDLGVDIASGLVVNFKQVPFKLAVCNPPVVTDQKTNSEARMTLRRIATAMRHSKDNWIVNCRIGGSIFSSFYKKFQEASNGAEDIRHNSLTVSVLKLLKDIFTAKQVRPLYLFSKGEVAGKILQTTSIEEANQDAVFSSFLISSQTASSSVSE